MPIDQVELSAEETHQFSGNHEVHTSGMQSLCSDLSALKQHISY